MTKKTTNVYEENFKKTLVSISQKGITSKDELMSYENSEEYANLWFSVQNFINKVALKSKHRNSSMCKSCNNISKCETCKNAYGNYHSVNSLLEVGAYDGREDIESDVLLKVMDKLDAILSQPIAKQYNYTYTIVNNFVNDLCKKFLPKNIHFISLQEEIKSNGHSSDGKITTYEETIGDPITPCDELIARETIEEKLRLQTEEMCKKREALISAITLLKNKRAELMSLCYIDELHKKPAALTKLIMKNPDKISAIEMKVLLAVCKKYSLNTDILSNLFSGKPIDATSFKLETADPKVISAQISRLKGRAKDELKLKLNK